jgi:hypothetical protein
MSSRKTIQDENKRRFKHVKEAVAELEKVIEHDMLARKVCDSSYWLDVITVEVRAIRHNLTLIPTKGESNE